MLNYNAPYRVNMVHGTLLPITIQYKLVEQVQMHATVKTMHRIL